MIFLHPKCNFSCKTFGGLEKTPYLCIAIEKNNCNKPLGYGVMVTLQILVLPFLVRVRVAQQKEQVHIELALFVF